MSETPPAVRLVTVADEEAGQRLDNFLLRHVRGVPKTRIYKALRKGEVRVNKGRAKPDTRLVAGDVVRIPPVRESQARGQTHVPARWAERIAAAIVADDTNLLAINKPSGLAVHGGSGVDLGLIESLRLMYPEARYLELVHRLDRDTSGLILVARRASVLRELHAALRGDGVDKRYRCLVAGQWPAHLKQVEAPLERTTRASGERVVRVSGEGRAALTRFRVLERFSGATLLEAKPVTGRTHQIRVHARQAGHPILGDAKYGSPESERCTEQLQLPRLFLHAAALTFTVAERRYQLEAPLDAVLESALARLRRHSDTEAVEHSGEGDQG